MNFKAQLTIAALVSLIPAAANAETNIATKIGRYLGWGIGDGYHAGRCCVSTCSTCEAKAMGACLVHAEPILAPSRPYLPELMPAPETMGWIQSPLPASQLSPMARPMPARHMTPPAPWAMPSHQHPTYYQAPVAVPYAVPQPMRFVPWTRTYKPASY